MEVATAFRKVDEIPFDFARRRMSVVVAEHDGHHLLICKGAVEEILAVCARVQHGDKTELLTPQLLARIREVTAAQKPSEVNRSATPSPPVTTSSPRRPPAPHRP